MPRALKIHPNLQAWFAQRQWEPFGFQKKVWRAIANQQSGLIHATTGSGKTYAAWLGALNQVLQSPVPKSALGLRVLWITPMRALASDTTKALQAPLVELGLDQAPWSLTVGQRTGDTSAAERARQTKKLPMALVTTPESLTLMLSRSVTRDQLAHLDLVVIDEWHELMGNKRGVQVQLALARLRHWRPQLSVWGLSATLGNLDQAMQVLLNSDQGLMVQGEVPKKIRVDTLLPDSTERFPWGGHLGLRMLPKVVAELEQSQSALVFTNTRAQAEIWYNALLDARPDWAGLIALHHGSLDKGVREWVEAGLKDGRLTAVVCTSSLDLGVDFSPVERVLQVGSAKGVARILQRAGRSGHAPGQLSRLSLVPTNALELIEGAALRDAIAARTIEPRHSPDKPLDVLVQHIVTIALSMQTTAAQLFQEVRSCYAYRNLTDQEWEWALSFTGHGGGSLTAYPEFHRIATREDSVLWVPDAAIARRHRMSVGTIVSDASVKVQYLNGSTIGSVEETFISRLKQGECFLFAGRLLELHRLHDMTAYVKKASGKRPAVPRWNGGKMPLSSELAQAFVNRLDQAALGRFEGADMQLAKPLLELQARWSSLPVSTVLLVEAMQSREGFHLFVYPFSGRHVHIGLSSLIAWRISQTQAATFSIAVNDYGFELLSATPQDWESELKRALEIKQTQPINSTSSAVEPNQLLLDDVLASLNASELSQRRFREIARISGLITQGYQGAPRSNKQLQASSSLFYEVFKKYDAQNLLLRQSEREVLQQELDLSRLQSCLIALQTKQLVFKTIEQPTPFAFPLMIERLREKLSTEKLSDRIARLVQELEKAATP